MYKTHRPADNILELCKFIAENGNNSINENNNNSNNMQLLNRRVFLNLTNTLQTYAASKQMVVPLGVQRAAAAYTQQHRGPPTQKLLNFPAFPLDQTIARFIESAQPLLNAEEFEITKNVAQKFLEKEGPVLQELLEKVAAEEENWLAHRWLRTAYMQYRDPVTAYSSPGMTFPIISFKGEDEYLLYTAKVIYGLIKYKQLIDLGKIPVLKMGKYELDNSQFCLVYGTCRIPQPREDRMEYNPDSTYVVVVYKNHFYKLPVYNKAGVPLHPTALVAELKKIYATEENKGVQFGLLSTDNRDNWAEAYQALIEPEGNKASVTVIQKSLFTVSLDDCIRTECGREYSAQSEQLIHGGGPDKNSANRWMDKTIQVVVNRNGMSGFTYEHSPAEGQPIALMTDYVVKHLDDDLHYEGAATTDYENAQKLSLQTSQKIDKHIETAKVNINKLIDDLQMNVLHYRGYGKEFIKNRKLSPDSLIQMAIQFTFYKIHGVPAAQYESAHLRIYTGGRTETIRSCSNDSLALCKAMLDHQVDADQRVKLLRKAVITHRDYTTIALQGRGVDRHLLGLKLMAIENKMPIPELYKTPGYIKSSHFRVATSQVAAENVSFMCYGPSTHDGYGCCYNPRKDDIIFAISAWRSNKETSAHKFADEMNATLDTMWQLLSSYGDLSKL